MRMAKTRFTIFLLAAASGATLAEPVRQECLGRMTFEVSGEIEWATYDPYEGKSLGTGIQGFSPNVKTTFDKLLYDHDGLSISVSDEAEKDKLEKLVTWEKMMHYMLSKGLTDSVETTRFVLELAQKLNYSAEKIAEIKTDLQRYEHELMLNQEYEHDLGIADTKAIGTQGFPTKAFLWRQQRLYTFSLKTPTPGAGERLKDLVSRFEPRALYEIPLGPGVCLPYGFIRDDGNTHFEFKYSLRFEANKNIIVGLINASANNPWHSKPAFGTVNDYLPTYDFSALIKLDLQEPLSVGSRPETFAGWHLKPKLDNGKQEHLWYGLAQRDGLSEPLVALQVHTVKQGVDGIESVTPPPEKIMPLISVISRSIDLKALSASLKTTMSDPTGR